MHKEEWESSYRMGRCLFRIQVICRNKSSCIILKQEAGSFKLYEYFREQVLLNSALRSYRGSGSLWALRSAMGAIGFIQSGSKNVFVSSTLPTRLNLEHAAQLPSILCTKDSPGSMRVSRLQCTSMLEPQVLLPSRDPFNLNTSLRSVANSASKPFV